ncbi:MAG: phenylalanine--tRNA ligase subunit beta [Chlorobi bacterium]|nr:phenylalanine--tRNA ligase subunit beta [Chlorobiota bacterium]
MRILLSWLREYVEWSGTSEQLVALLIHSGIEVESVEHCGIDSDNIVSATIVGVEPHPNADRLTVCTVNDGIGNVRVVCGAPNVATGQRVALARVGAQLPNGARIERRVIRGVESEGMLCSERELGLGDRHDGILVLEDSIPPGYNLRSVFPPDTVLEVSVTPNRADALSHFGIARIVATANTLRATLPEVILSEADGPRFEVDIAEPQLCWRYRARLLENVHIVQSPKWLQIRLQRAGLRPRNVVVDVTNYVMLECGHPLHAFDFDKIKGGRIIVRCAQPHEKHFETLDGIDRPLDPSMLCICDSAGPVAIAGIIGGANSAISDSTQRVLLESAYFLPSSIRRTAKKLGLQTDASFRFERGVDIEMLSYALDRAAALIAELTDARISGFVDRYPTKKQQPTVSFCFERAERLLGVQLDRDAITASLEAGGFDITQHRDDGLVLRVPTYRQDISEEIDIVEEVAIAIGYDSIPVPHYITIPQVSGTIPSVLRPVSYQDKIRHILTAIGFHEALSYNLCDPESAIDPANAIELSNPLGRERSVLRQWLVPSLVEMMSRNARHGVESIRLFDIAKVFSADAMVHSGIAERAHLGLACAGKATRQHWLSGERDFDLYDIKGVVERIVMLLAGVRSEYDLIHNLHWQITDDERFRRWFELPLLKVILHGRVIGHVGKVHSELTSQMDIPAAAFIGELELEGFTYREQLFNKYVPPSPFPTIIRDIALIVDCSVQSGDIVTVIAESAGQWLLSVEPFDVFVHPSFGERRKSIAFRLTFGSSERTLTDEDVAVLLDKILAALSERFDARLRTS